MKKIITRIFASVMLVSLNFTNGGCTELSLLEQEVTNNTTVTVIFILASVLLSCLISWFITKLYLQSKLSNGNNSNEATIVKNSKKYSIILFIILFLAFGYASLSIIYT